MGRLDAHYGESCDRHVRCRSGRPLISLEKALEQVGALPEDEQDVIASQILSPLADDDAWKKRFAGSRDVISRMAREAFEEDERGETRPLEELL